MSKAEEVHTAPNTGKLANRYIHTHLHLPWLAAGLLFLKPHPHLVFSTRQCLLERQQLMYDTLNSLLLSVTSVIPENSYAFMQPNWSAVSYFLHVNKLLNISWFLYYSQVSKKKYIYVFTYDSRTEKEIMIQQRGQETVALTLRLLGSYALSGAHTLPWVYWPSQRCHTLLE